MHPDYTSQVTPQMPKTVVSASGQTESEGRQGARKEVRCSRREMHDEQGSQESGQREGEQDPASMTTPQLSRTSANAITLIEGSEEEHLGKGSGIGRERQYNDGETRKSEGKDLVSKAASWLPGFGAKSEGDGGHDLRKELKNLQAKLYSQERARKDDAAKVPSRVKYHRSDAQTQTFRCEPCMMN
ncbi:hypothetical protein JAAARDRAFT_68660 [Jaapia argillacea MUCL 33604]|uniref:Uncharacterized protein n=1 Tax=Jaapia argillacea MUCL 33604 TaxID=933084 RepID=A0A067PWB2_9AGAM|nr:hypothetical protein JAAARDRAFT_68660 [Jaapia argillacea MUCL 33604]